MDPGPLDGAMEALVIALRSYADWAAQLAYVPADPTHAEEGQVLAANVVPAIARARALLDLPRTCG